MSQKKTKEIIASLSVLIVIVAIVGAAAAMNSSDTKHTGTSKTTSAEKNVVLSSTPAVAGSTYKNGTFKGTGTYDSPGGPEAFNLSVTVKDDVISDTSATSGSKDFTSRSYQMDFIAAYKQLVVGKKVDEVGNIGTVSGSSLTGQGFAKALDVIKQEAKA